MRHFLFAAVAVVGLSARANIYITPVATANLNGRVYVTTTLLRNSGAAAVRCQSVYALLDDPKGGSLRANYLVEPGAVHVDEGTFMEAAAIGTLRFDCTGSLLIAVHMQASSDGGKTFDSGRFFRAIGEENALFPGSARSIKSRSDLLMMEVNGKPARALVIVKDGQGRVLGQKSYEIFPFGEQIVNLSAVRAKGIAPVIEISINGVGAAIVITPQSEDASLVALFKRNTHSASSIVTDRPSVIQQLTVSPFKAAPFVEPLNGLIYMRNRWYDPHTGSFLTPDRTGYGDSANLYSFCGGDPVNCSDPTGLAASAGQKGWIVASDNRNGGRIRRFSPAEIAADPQKVRAFLGANADVDPREADAILGRAGAAWATGAGKMRVVALVAAKAAGVYPLMAATAGAGLGGAVGIAASSELGLGFVGSAMLPGFTAGVGSQAGVDVQSGRFSGVRHYALSGSVGAIGSLALGAAIRGTQRVFGIGTPQIVPIGPEGGWRPLFLPSEIAATFESGKFTARVLTEDLIVYRAEGQMLGRWFGMTEPESAAAAEHLYNLSQYGNDLTTVSAYRIPARTIVWEGRVAGGSGWQYYVPNPRGAGVIQIARPQPLPQSGF